MMKTIAHSIFFKKNVSQGCLDMALFLFATGTYVSFDKVFKEAHLCNDSITSELENEMTTI